MYDAKLPENLWDLAVTAAVYAYNRTPHKANDMITPLERFAPDPHFDINQLKRFGCIAYIKVHRKIGPKFRAEGRRVVLVGYTPTGYQFLRPEEGKFYESREVKFNEKVVYGDKFSKNAIKDFPVLDNEINKEKWFIEFEKEKKSIDSSIPEGETKRRRGRPRKDETRNAEDKTPVDRRDEMKLIEDVSFSDLELDESQKASALLINVIDEEIDNEINEVNDEFYHALLSKINLDPINYKEAMLTTEKNLWQLAIEDEFKSLDKNEV